MAKSCVKIHPPGGKIKMTYKECIDLCIEAITYILEDGLSLKKEKTKETTIVLNENGFVQIEQDKTNIFLPSSKEYPVAPSYVLSKFFNGYTDIMSDNKQPHMITNIVSSLISLNEPIKYKRPFSYIELVNKITNLINKYQLGATNSSLIDLDYIHLKRSLSSVEKDQCETFQNRVLNIGNLKYQELINLSITHPETARIIERMYQIELLLEEYCRKNILLEQGRWEQSFSTQSLQEVDLESPIDWESFCDIIAYANYQKQRENTIYWKESQGKSQNTTILGLEEIILPGEIEFLEDSKVHRL